MTKVKRNMSCPCGSGKKYKYCCYQENIIPITLAQSNETINSPEPEMSKAILCTQTDEIFSFCRLIYKLYNKSQAVKMLEAISSISYDHSAQKGDLHYTDELNSLDISLQPLSPPKDPNTYSLAHIRCTEDKMIIDCISHERLLMTLLYFDKYISREVLEVKQIILYNRCFAPEIKESNLIAATDLDMLFHPDIIFNPENVRQKALFKDMGNLKNETHKIEIDEQYKRIKSQKLLEVEVINIDDYYEVGLDSIKLDLVFRQQVACQHYFGNTDLTLGEFTLKTMSSILNSEEFKDMVVKKENEDEEECEL